MAERVEFRLPLPPSRGNFRGHTRKQYLPQKHWERHAEIEMIRQGVRPPEKPWPLTRLSVVFHVVRPEDPDNLDARRKLIIDLLKDQWVAPNKHGVVRKLSVPPAPGNKKAVRTRAGFFRDDSSAHVRLTPSRRRIVKSAKDEHVAVTLERIEQDGNMRYYCQVCSEESLCTVMLEIDLDGYISADDVRDDLALAFDDAREEVVTEWCNRS